jgi:hypothetical protein
MKQIDLPRVLTLLQLPRKPSRYAVYRTAKNQIEHNSQNKRDHEGFAWIDPLLSDPLVNNVRYDRKPKDA